MRALILVLISFTLAGCVDLQAAREKKLEEVRKELERLRGEPVYRDPGPLPFNPPRPPRPAPPNPCPDCVRSADIPRPDRYENWGGGSCYYASTCNSLVNLRNGDYVAYLIRQNYSGGASIGNIKRALDRYRVDYVYTARGDWDVLEYANRNNLCAAIEFKTNHACSFVGMDPAYVWNGYTWTAHPDRHVWVLDNNHVNRIEKYTLAAFKREWYRNGGRAIVPLGVPMPPVF